MSRCALQRRGWHRMGPIDRRAPSPYFALSHIEALVVRRRTLASNRPRRAGAERQDPRADPLRKRHVLMLPTVSCEPIAAPQPMRQPWRSFRRTMSMMRVTLSRVAFGFTLLAACSSSVKFGGVDGSKKISELSPKEAQNV